MRVYHADFKINLPSYPKRYDNICQVIFPTFTICLPTKLQKQPKDQVHVIKVTETQD